MNMCLDMGMTARRGMHFSGIEAFTPEPIRRYFPKRNFSKHAFQKYGFRHARRDLMGSDVRFDSNGSDHLKRGVRFVFDD